MRKKNVERTTINMMFLCEANVNVEKNSIVQIPDSHIELKADAENINIYKDGELFKTKIKNFKSLCSDILNGISTIDFWTSDFLEEIAKNNYCSQVKLSNAISSNVAQGYILEAIISFPNESEFYIKWNEERTKKGELYMRSFSNF